MEIPIAIPIPIAIAIAIFGADHRRGTVLYGTITLRSVPYGKIFDVQHGGDQEVRYHVGALLSFPRSFDSDFWWWSILKTSYVVLPSLPCPWGTYSMTLGSSSSALVP
jgi:hypothetical protein